MTTNYYSAIEDRRTYYSIGKETVASDDRIQEVIEHAVKHTPSAFNSQSARVVLLFGDNHTNLWNITKEALRKVVPAESFADTEAKIDSFSNGYGTVLFFDDNAVVEELQRMYALYKDNFPVWAQQSNGMLQYVIWTSLKVEGYGASLQHYNELIEADVKNEWSIPGSWKLIAQMPFGKPTAEPGEKDYMPINERVIIYK